MNGPLFGALDEHLNSGCTDSRCDFVLNPTEDQSHFPKEFIEHLVEEILDTLAQEPNF